VVFTIPAKTIAAAPPEEDWADFERESTPPPAAPPAPDGPAYGPPAAGHYSPEELVAMGRAAAADPRQIRGFWSDVAWTFGLFIEPHNLAMLVVIWVLHGFLPLLSAAGCIGLVGLLIVYGWLCSYWFNVIADAAGGEDRLPSMGLTEGFLDDVLFPLLKFIGATVLAWAPAIACGVIVALATGAGSQQVLANPDLLMMVMIAVSMFLLPIALLVTAIGGIAAAVRVDLIFVTIARTILPYLAVCLLFAGTSLLEGRADELTSLLTGGGTPSFWFQMVVASLPQAYFSIVSMRIVGLYYHHFKNRFAWSWG
jgi:hypothetical protein